MKYRISVALILSLLLSMLFMPLAVAADDGKFVIKEMVQSPEDYGVGGIVVDPFYRLYESSFLRFNPFVFMRIHMC